jgi:hypothetical protein
VANAALQVIDRIHDAALKAVGRIDRGLKVAARTIEVVGEEIRIDATQTGHVVRMDRPPREEIQIEEARKVEVPRASADQTARRRGVRVLKVRLAITMDAAIEVQADRHAWIVIDEALHAAIVLIAVRRVEARRSRIVDPARADLRGCSEDRSVDHNPVADLHSVANDHSAADLHSAAVDLVVHQWAHRG